VIIDENNLRRVAETTLGEQRLLAELHISIENLHQLARRHLTLFNDRIAAAEAGDHRVRVEECRDYILIWGRVERATFRPNPLGTPEEQTAERLGIANSPAVSMLDDECKREIRDAHMSGEHDDLFEPDTNPYE
jgi:hypothetical protein